MGDIQCDSNPMVNNGDITSEISTEVGSIVQFNCSSGFTLNGRVGTLTCNAEGVFEPDLVCEDCRFQDAGGSFGTITDTNRQADDEIDCTELCNADPQCVSSQFSQPNTCTFDFQIDRFETDTPNLEQCRRACFTNIRCEAFIAFSGDLLSFPCLLFTKPFSSFTESSVSTSSSCI
ncbi:hypothetical protein LOTGIDRAFT_238386 [Lottia gigantea]|uniref:Sushi domain-containing protein n=1 Tax=Lottia gigantea TaxID=225164 RepID=V4AUH2_LOTGI|nr:hypothetical protein LOTGIDRAFT_238386 [Lottia gigantea]ESP00958.1 hypothetical protein LOTGIDRAFT_238386 [Lottia gigantea]